MIDDRVRATEGGFEATNGFVRATIRAAVEKAQLSFESDLSDVVVALGEHDWRLTRSETREVVARPTAPSSWNLLRVSYCTSILEFHWML